MKLTRYFFVVAVSTALATGLTGCLSQDEFLEEHSYKFDDQTFYQSESDMELALNGCYRQIQSLMMGQTHGSHSWMIGESDWTHIVKKEEMIIFQIGIH